MSSSVLPLKAKQDVRPGTRSPGTLASALISSSVIPSLKYSSFLSALMFTNGSTATDLAGAAPPMFRGRCELPVTVPAPPRRVERSVLGNREARLAETVDQVLGQIRIEPFPHLFARSHAEIRPKDK